VTVAVNVTDCPNTDGFTEETTAVFVGDLFTVCVRTLDVLPRKFASPGYTAVIGCAPTERVAVLSVACPAPFSVPVPRLVAPSMKVTIPVGVPEPGATAATVAVKVTDCPKTDGFTLETTAVVVDAWLTT